MRGAWGTCPARLVVAPLASAGLAPTFGGPDSRGGAAPPSPTPPLLHADNPEAFMLLRIGYPAGGGPRLRSWENALYVP